MKGKISIEISYAQTNVLLWAADEAKRSAEYRGCSGSLNTARAAIELAKRLQESFVKTEEKNEPV